MKIIKSEQILAVDIDNTLLLWDEHDSGNQSVVFTDPYTGETKQVKVHEAHLRIVKSRLSRGAVLLVWSSSGYRWVEAALFALQLEHPRVIVLSKPIAYIDDKPCAEWMGERIYLPNNSKYGK